MANLESGGGIPISENNSKLKNFLVQWKSLLKRFKLSHYDLKSM